MTDDLPPKEYLERQKLAAELQMLARDAKYDLLRLVFSGLQALAVILGVYLGVSEFVIKDRAQRTQQQSIALSLIERGESAVVRKARESLKKLREDAYAVPVDSKLEGSTFPAIVTRFANETQELAGYFRGLNRGVRAGYIDADLVVMLLADDIRSVGDTLDDILGRMGHPGDKGDYPDLKPYCGFYALREKLDPKMQWKKAWGFDPCNE